MVRLEIPTDWTPEEARTIAGFLDTVAAAIWQAYRLQAVELNEAQSEWDEPPLFDDTTYF